MAESEFDRENCSLDELKEIEAATRTFVTRLKSESEQSVVSYFESLSMKESSTTAKYILKELIKIKIRHDVDMGKIVGPSDFADLAFNDADVISVAFDEFQQAVEEELYSQGSPPEGYGNWMPFVDGKSLKKGGMGVIRISSHDRSFNRQIALKSVLLSKFQSGEREDVERRFWREANIQASLNHPNIPPVHEQLTLTEPTGVPCFSMKLIIGKALDEVLEGFQPAPEIAQMIGFISKVSEAVGHAHSKGIVHRDLKPKNIMVGEFGEVQVIDWGFAVELESGNREEQDESKYRMELESWPHENMDSTVVLNKNMETNAGGTPAYMSPEHFETAQLCPASDVFSIGSIICEVLIGRPVYTGNDALKKAAKSETSEALNLLNSAKKAANANAGLFDICLKCLDLNPEKRYQNGHEIANAIKNFQKSFQDRYQAKLIADGKRKWLFASATLAVLLIATLGITWAAYSIQRVRQQTEEKDRIGQMERDVSAVSNSIYKAIIDDDIALARSEYSRLQAFLTNSPPLHLAKSEREIGEDLEIAESIDEIRQERMLRMISHLIPENISLKKYKQFFKTNFEESIGSELGNRISSSRLEPVFMKALQDWYLLENNNEIRKQLLEAMKQVNVDVGWLAEIDSDLSYEQFYSNAIPDNNHQPSPYRIVQIVSKLPIGDPRAVKLLRDVEPRAPDNFWIQLSLATHLSNSSGVGRETKRDLQAMSLAHARSAISINKSSDTAILAFAHLCFEQGLFEELEMLSKFPDEEDEQSWIRHAILALQLTAKGEFGNALHHWYEAYSIEPSLTYLKQEMASCLAFTGADKQAEEIIAELLEVNPENIHALMSLISIKDTPTEKRQLALRVLELDPENETARQTFGMALAEDGRFYEAAKIFSTMDFGKVTHPHLPIVAAVALLIKGEKKEAIIEANSAYSNSEFWLGEMIFAMALGQNGRWEESSRHFDNAVQEFKTAGTPINGLGAYLGSAVFLPRSGNIRNVIQYERDKATYLPTKGTDWRDVKKTYLDNPILRFKVSYLPGLADFFLSHDQFLHATLIYELSVPVGSIFASQPNFTVMQGSYKIAAARAAAQASVTYNNDLLTGITNEDRDHFRDLAFSWLESELEVCGQTIRRKNHHSKITFLNTKNRTEVGLSLSLMMLHRDFESIRNPIFINQMPEDDRKRAFALWKNVKQIYESYYETEVSFQPN